MAELIPKNDARGALASGIDSDDTTATLDTGEGARFNDPGGTDVVRAMIVDDTDETVYEYITITDRAGDVLTITRGAESSTPQTWAAGSRVAEILTYAGVEALLGAAGGAGVNNILAVEVFG